MDLSGWLASLDEQDAAAKAGAENAAQPAESNFTDWSGSSLFADDAEPATQAEAPQPAASDEDDWLSKLNLDREETAPEAPAAQTPGGNSNLWADAESGEPAAETPAAAEDDMAWLNSLQLDSAEPGAGAGPAAEMPPAAPEAEQSASSGWGLTGWLNQNDAPAEPPASEAPSPGADKNRPQPGTPEWLAGLASTPAAAGSSWFADEPAANEEPSAQAPDSELPAWLLESSAEPVEPASPAQTPGGMPSWLMDEPAAPEAQTPAAASDNDNAMPSWLADEPTPSAAQTPPPQAPVEGMPAWLSDMAQEPASAAPVSQEPQRGSDDLPSWMQADFGAEETVPTPGSTANDDQLPGWFSSFNEPADQPSAAEQPAAGIQPAAEIQPANEPADVPPDFAFNLFSMPDEPARPEPARVEPAKAQAPEEQPDWLSSLAAADEEAVPTEEPHPDARAGSGPLPFIEGGLPDWMNEFQGQQPTDSTVAPLIPAEDISSTYTNKDQPFDIQLPDWLDEEAAQRSADEQTQSATGQPSGEDLAHAELPSWVAAMRPVETVVHSDAGLVDNDQNVERAGPLSGMRGVLPADDSVINYRKPPVYSMKLRVTEKQRGHSALLESLVGQETQPLLLPAQKSQAPQVVLRVLVALFMLVVLAGALLVKWQTPTPTLIPPDTLDFYDQVEALPVDQTVLLAVDYEAGLSGEMRFASSTVIDHLMARNVALAVVSTVPTGPAMADSLLKQVQENRADYDLAAKAVNLGYLPGGTISLVEFARNPQGAAPQTVGGEYAWDKPALTGIDDIQKFSSVIVVTDSAETGRDWVEQVQPYLGNVPLLFVTSAQAAPLLEPYVESRQVQGLVSGLLGGTLYGQQTGRQDVNPAMGHYGAYQVGVLLAFVLVLIGAIVSSLTSFATRNKKNR
jgi:hypothetical protein